MPISSQTPIIGYVANGVTKSFAFPFAILSADDLKVKVGADVVTTGFSIAGVGDRDGGSVTFTDAPASLTPIILYREVTLDRTTDYQENGDLLAIVLDDDFDRVWMALQDQLLLADRAVRVPIGETLQQLPPASERALMALAFDAAGNPIVVRGTNDGGAALALDLLDTAPGKGAALVGYDSGTAQDVLDEAKPMANYTALRAYTGRATGVRITQSGLAGFFWRDASDTTSADNGGTIIVDGAGRRWKRLVDGSVNVKWFGAVGDGVTDDTTAFGLAVDYATANDKSLLVDGELNLSTWVAKTLSASLVMTGNGVGKIIGNGANLLHIGNGVGVAFSDISIQGVGTALKLSGTGDHPFIELENVAYTSSGPVCNSGAINIQSIKVVNSRFTTISGEAVFKTNSYIKHALFSGNVFKDITSATSHLEVLRLGKTQYADQPLTGNYIISDNLFETMTANGGATGEVHAIILYGDRATISGNIIKDIDRPLARQAGGVEGIYTKVRSVAVTGNVLVNAGFAEGNKGAQINIKGDILVGSTDTVGANSTVNGNVIYSTDSQHRNGIRVEGDNTTIVGNTLVGINGAHAIGLAWTYANSRNALIANNSICKPNTTSTQIWINAVGENIVVDGNIIEANAASGAYTGISYTDVNRTSGSVDKIRITNNTIDATGIEYGVLVLATARTMTNLVINENHIKGGTYGIRAISTTYITSGEVRRNYFNGTTLAYRDKSTLTLRYSDNFKDNVPQDTWAAAPTVGTWAVGDIVYASTPATLGFIGWVCTVAGTPGTWKTFGAVTP